MKISKSNLAFVILFTAILTSLAQAQKPAAPVPTQTPVKVDQDDVVKITTNLVQVDAVVTKDGKPVRDLKAEDFEIYEDGHKQEISSFAFISNVGTTSTSPPETAKPQATALPPAYSKPLRPNDPRRVIALVVDDLGLSVQSMAAVRKQLRKFVDQQLAPNDLVAIIRTGGTVGALQQFTNDSRLIDKALSQVKWNICSRVGTSVFAPSDPFITSLPQEPGNCGNTSVNSIIVTMRALRFIVEAMGEIPGRKSMIVFSDSLPREEQDFTSAFAQRQEPVGATSLISPDNRDFNSLLYKIAEKAIRSSVVIYAVDAGGLQYTGLTAADNLSNISSRTVNNSTLQSRSLLIQQRREGAELIAKETGGFLVRNSNDFQLDKILEDQSGYYLLGYRPTDETFNRKFHHIKARVKKPGLSLRTRYGFFGVSEDDVDRAKRAPTDKAMVALMSPFGAQELLVDLNAFFTNDKDGSLIRSLVFLSAKDLSFTDEPDGWHNATIRLQGMIFGDNGAIVDQQTFARKISLRGETYQKALRDGFMIRFDMPVKRSGAYQMRIAALDVTTSKVGAAGMFVQVPDLSNHHLALSGIVVSGSDINDHDSGVSALRHFNAGTNLQFGCGIFNAMLDQTTKSPNISVQAQLFREDKQVFSSPAMKVDTSNQTDMTRLVATGVLRLNPNLETGPYFLQLIATDLAAKDKQVQAVQWIDFEIVK